MKRYSETENNTTGYVYDWPTILVDIEKDLYGMDSLEDAWTAAGDWSTCPVGNLSDKILRRCGGEPVDEVLLSLGHAFFRKIIEIVETKSSGSEVSQDLFRTTRDLLRRIERVSKRILKEMREDEQKGKKARD